MESQTLTQPIMHTARQSMVQLRILFHTCGPFFAANTLALGLICG